MQSEQEKPEKYERRQGPDTLCRVVGWLAIAGWILFIFALVLAHYASPDLNTGLVRYWGIEIRNDWHPKLTVYLQYLLWVVAVLSGLSLLLNRQRLRRSDDHVHFNIIILLLSSISMLMYLYFHL